MTLNLDGTHAQWNWVFISLVPLMSESLYNNHIATPSGLYVDNRFKTFSTAKGVKANARNDLYVYADIMK